MTTESFRRQSAVRAAQFWKAAYKSAAASLPPFPLPELRAALGFRDNLEPARRPKWAVHDAGFATDVDDKTSHIYTDKLCTVCGHAACQLCETWCDVMTGEDLCCDGRCTYDGAPPRFWSEPCEEPPWADPDAVPVSAQLTPAFATTVHYGQLPHGLYSAVASWLGDDQACVLEENGDVLIVSAAVEKFTWAEQEAKARTLVEDFPPVKSVRMVPPAKRSEPHETTDEAGRAVLIRVETVRVGVDKDPSYDVTTSADDDTASLVLTATLRHPGEGTDP